MQPFTRVLRQPLDTMFWRSYGDEIRLHPEAPVSCCLLGMSHVFLILWIFVVALLVPFAHVLQNLLRSSRWLEAVALPPKLHWFIGICVLAGLISGSIVMRLYWRYRLSPDRAMRLDTNYDRGRATAYAVGLSAGVLALMAAMFKLFW
jgi:hypothetical protein